jgi:glyoxylase-like metal-dependent hydrolase (beta-lactamase superfamily II)
MSEKWKVMALCTGTLDLYKAVVTLGLDFPKAIRENIWSYAVYNSEHKMLIDTGIHDVKWVNDFSRPCYQAEDETLAAAMKKGLGWETEDVDIVINTHLHYDHCGGNMFLPNARFYVQKSEFEFAHHPFKSQKQFYLNKTFDVDTINHFRWSFLEGDQDILPGIKVIATPGHTPGHQSVLVDTVEGVVCMSGDGAGILQNFSHTNLNTCSIKMNEEEVYASYDRMAMCAQFVCPTHDPNIKKYQENGFPRIKDLQEDKADLHYPEIDESIYECVYVEEAHGN